MTQIDAKWLKRYRLLFVAAAFWNIAAVIGALGRPAYHRSLFFAKSIQEPGFIGHLNTVGFWGSVLVFGIGYAIVAMDPRKNHGIIWMAIIGKLFVAVWWAWYFFQGKLTSFALTGAIGDAVFAFIFLGFLSHYKKLSSSD